jgi:tetratricopeptide (TPR) repeat protein
VDSAAVARSGVLSPKYLPYMLPEMIIDLSGKHALGKQEITILDMLNTNNWQRPMYYAITVASDQHVNLDNFFQQTGMAYQIVPFNARNTAHTINTERMYDKVMNKFKWGGVSKPGIYLDETVMRMCKTYRMSVFTPLARALINEGEREKALKVLDKAMEVLPPENVPLDYTAIYLGELYYRLGVKEKAESICEQMAEIAVNNLEWFFRLRPSHFATVKDSAERELYALQEAVRLGETNKSEFVAKYKETFNRLYATYSALSTD